MFNFNRQIKNYLKKSTFLKVSESYGIYSKWEDKEDKRVYEDIITAFSRLYFEQGFDEHYLDNMKLYGLHKKEFMIFIASEVREVTEEKLNKYFRNSNYSIIYTSLLNKAYQNKNCFFVIDTNLKYEKDGILHTFYGI